MSWLAARRALVAFGLLIGALFATAVIIKSSESQGGSLKSFRVNPNEDSMIRIDRAVLEFRRASGSLPNTLSELSSRRPYLDSKYLIDSWGRNYRIEFTGSCATCYVIRSNGADGIAATADDISYPP